MSKPNETPVKAYAYEVRGNAGGNCAPRLTPPH